MSFGFFHRYPQAPETDDPVTHMDSSKPHHRLRPSEVLSAFSTAKAKAARHASSKIIEFVNAEDHTTRVSSAVPLHKPLFEPTPAEVWIDEYTPFHTTTVKLSFRNCDAVARRFKIEPCPSPFFKLLPFARPSDSGRIDGKIAAGMETAFTLEFYPQEVNDYAVDLVCATERERFLLPVRVRGRRAALDIPDTIRFGFCPVKMATTKVLAVHNIGNMGARFAFATTEWFSIAPASAALEQGASVQLELTHCPLTLAARQGELVITDDTGQSVVVELTGDVGQVDVYLSQPLVEPSATYLSLSSRKIVKICNESEHTLEFSWKAFPDHREEETERERLLDELARLEATEMEQLNYELLDAEHSLSTLSHQSPFNARKALETKYRHLRKASLEDNMQFVDDCFSLQPMTGRVWAHSEVDVVTCFSPAMALLYSCSAFLDIAGQEARLPLQIRGQGIGPKAKVVYNELLDFGDVFISDKRTRDFTIQNKGEIPAVFDLLPMQLPAGVWLEVQPAQGTLALNEMRKIEVSFFSQVLGDEFQHIRFRLQGSEDQLLVRFKAHVIPPVFHFDVDLIDFGAVSYSFPHTKTLKLINASKIAMEYVLKIPEEANYKHKEFELTPSSGNLEAYGEQEIVLHFTSFNVKSYDYHLVVNVAGVGSDLLSVPIRAQCFVPEIVIQQPDLEFGASFLRYPHKQMLLLENKSTHLFGRFEITEQDDHSRAIAMYTASEATGSIGPGEKRAVDIFLSCEKLGSIRLPMTVEVPGSSDLPIAVTLTAVGTGPKVLLDQNEIHWGNCTCLVDHERLLTMTNTSLIPAYYKTFIRNARSKFQIDQNEGTLPPGETVRFVLVANLDDTVVFKDQLHILITEGENLVLPLAIKGIGTTMWSPSELRVIDFGHQMTCKECEWSCTLENKGKRSQVLTWTNRTTAANKKAKISEVGLPTDKKSSALAKSGSKPGKASGNGSQANDVVEDVIPVFSVFPGTIELKPRTACVFVFKGISAAAGLVLEELVCETRVGKEKVNKIAFVTQIQGNFLDPKLTPSVPNLAFEYIHYPGSEINRQSQPLSLTNACALPLSFTLRTQTPFSLDCWEAVLQPGEQVAFNVEFYPGYKDDYTCRVINGKVFVAYTSHPQKDSIDLLGDISFPNLSFDTTKIDFGCTLNDTQTSIFVEIANVSKVDTSFRWVFIEDEKEARANATAKKPYMPINQVFDILPIRGHLKPDERERIEFIYYGHANRKFKSTVACEVDGGPEYELTLLGEASSLVYRLDKQCLDFGQVLYNKTEDREFSILNVGKVSFAFNIIVEGISRGRSVEVTPMMGKIAPNDKQRILVRLRPGIPEQFDETIVIEVAHFQPIEFKLFGSGIFSSVLINLPRENHPSSAIQGANPKWKNLKKHARRNLEASTLSAALVNRDGAMSSSDSKSTISATARGIAKANSFRSVAAKSVSPTAKAPSPQKSSFQGGLSRLGAGSGSGAPIIDDLDIETEACRVFFAEYLIVQDAKRLEPRGSGKIETIEPEETSEAIRTEDSKAAGEKPTKRKAPETFPFILSQFVLEFGNVVLGTHKIKKFSITNIGHVPASFQLDKNLALSKGFQVEPERVVRLPEKQAVEFTVTFQARKSIAMGIHQAQLPIVMKNGPPTLLTIRAHVTVPDIAISMDTLDFGKMAVSTCHTMFTQIHNTSTVSAEWAIKKPMGSARDISNFRIIPQMGVLAPGAKANLQVTFVPDDGRLFSIKLPIKVNANPKTRSITCRGEGSELRVSFNPAMVELGPMLPCSGISKALVEIRNDSEYPVEVFSLDFDQQFKQDEELLRTLNVYNADGVLQLPVRVPGQSIQQYLVDNGLVQVNAPDPADDQRLEGATDDNPDHTASATSLHPSEHSLTASESVSNVVDDMPENPQTITRTGVDYILLGPPRCGISTQARLLAEKENMTAWAIDDAIKAVCLEQNDLGTTTRVALGLEHDALLEQFADTTKLSPANSSSEFQDSSNNDLNGEQSNGEQTQQSKIEMLLNEILLWRLTQPDLRHGGVLDGCDSSLVSFEAAIRACSQVLPRARVVWLSFDEDAFETMNSIQTRMTPSSSKGSIHASSKASLATSPENDEDVTPDAEENLAESDQSAAVELVLLNADDAAPEESDNQQATTSIERQLSALMKTASPSYKSSSFSTYQLVLEMRRRQVMLFLASKSQSHNNMAEHTSDLETSILPSQLHDLMRSDNFLLDIPITEPGPALHMHSMIYSAIEKCIRDLESSHLVVPPAAKYQMIPCPPERFARKPVSRFILRHPPSMLSGSDPEPAMDEALVDSDATHELKTEDEDKKVPDPELQPAMRWVIAPHESAYTAVHFETSDVGVFDCALGFEIVGVRREFTLFCRGNCSVPTINSDPRNVFMSRVKSRPEGVFVHKKFVISRNQFEFGPLIVTSGANIPKREEDFIRAQKSSTSNIEVFRMTNTSRWPIQIDFGLENEEDKTFAVFPPSVNVAEGETGEIKVWACPLSDGLHENSVVCCISDNPQPLTFAISCYGCTPNLVLRGPWEQTVACSTSEEESPRDESASKSPAGPSLDFEQLLLKRQDEKTFFIENVSPVEVSWRLVVADLPSDFRLFPMEGVTKPFQKTPVLVVFSANVEAVYKHPVMIEFSDAESALQVAERKHFTRLLLQAEAYKIDVCSFQQESDASSGDMGDSSLDFGLVRVGESHARVFNIRNQGKYNIKFVVTIRKTASRAVFTIEPSEMILEPNSVAPVTVTFQSKQEITLRDCKDIKCTIIEMISGEPCREFHVLTRAKSVFSVFRLQSNRGINFGPHTYNDPPKSKKFEIKNEGAFPFKYRVLSSTAARASDVVVNEADLLTLETPLTPATLTAGQFSITPDCGSIDPGVAAVLDVVFQPNDCEVYREMLRIEISGRDLENAAESEMLMYELVAESCYPGINTTDYDSIFEEQIVIPTMGTNSGSTTTTSLTKSASGTTGMAWHSVIFAEREKLFSFGAMIAAVSAKGTVERFKISNPTKVATTVHFQIGPSSNSTPSGGNGGSTPRDEQTLMHAFTVQPSTWEIPPLEHRFVSVYFKPSAIMTYHAQFTAKVDDSPQHVDASRDTSLKFDLRGEGTMPCVTVVEPSQRDSNGILQMNFGRVRLAKLKELSLTLRNDGILPATVLFSMQSNPNYVFALGNGSIVVAPKAAETLSVTFKPQKAHDEPSISILKITVQNNPFEETSLRLAGTGYKEDVSFEDLPLGHDDELHFDDIQLRSGSAEHHGENHPDDANPAADQRVDVKVFSICNQSSDIMRFVWPKSPVFHFSPSVGHLKPRSFKLITATFAPGSGPGESRATVYHAHQVPLQLQRITYHDPSSAQGLPDWDETIRTVTFDAQSDGHGSTGEKLAEPAHESVGASTNVNLSCFAAADALSFECDVTSIAFKRTFMLQVCSHRIMIRNKSKIKLAYAWRWEHGNSMDTDGLFPVQTTNAALDDECPFELSPEAGAIAAEESQAFTIKFAPLEVDDFEYTLVFEPVEAQDNHVDGDKRSSRHILVRGSSVRPACHFDVERSDYAQRRALHLAGPSGELGPLDPAIKVIEMESLGVRVRNTRRFYVVNPTNVSYEFSWSPENDVNPCFRCATPKGLMLAGKRCEMIFEFTPHQLELQEMFWRFKIPQFEVNQLFLFVGTTTEPRVTLDRGSVNFNTLLIGTKTSQTIALINHEHIPFNFVFDKASLDFAGEAPALLMHPLSGVIPPNSRSSIDIEFIPMEEKTYNFNISCIVKRKPTRLSLNVKGEGYSIHDALTISSDDQNDLRSPLLGPGNILDFGVVRVNDESVRTIVIHNSGKFNFEFNWNLIKPVASFVIEPTQGTVKKNDKVACRLVYAPTKQSSLDGAQISCTVAGSRIYGFNLHGSAVPPSLQFSFTAHDFGPCFVAETDALPISETVVLTIFNMDPEIGIDLDCVFEKKAHLRVDCPPTALGPRESVNVPIMFTARQETTYMEMIPFVLNGSSTVSVSIRGEGVPPRIELVNMSMQNVAFGSLQIGQQVSRAIKIANRSKRKTLVEFLDADKVGLSSLSQLGISIFPHHEVTLRPKETADIEFKFAPTQRVPAFQKDIFIHVAGSRKKLLTLNGCCQGMDIALESDTVSFGTVCLGSQLVRKLRLQNRGDVAAKFQWNVQAFAPDFQISPAEGMVAPNQQKTLEVTFKPSAVNADIRYDRLMCSIDGTTNPLMLACVGSCVKQSASSISDMIFDSRVREESTKSITIENKSKAPWNLFPVVQGEHWSCPENIAIPAEGKATLDVKYLPLRMTRQPTDSADGIERPEQHEGSIFLAIPDGSALLYNVFGRASSPASAGSLLLTTPAKKTLPITISVKNWLKVSQTFAVEIRKPEENESIVVQGPSSITLHAGSTRNYNLKFFCYTEAQANLTVRFVNTESGEYLTYEIAVAVSTSAEVETLHFEAPARQAIKKMITIENPFPANRFVAFENPANWWKCSSSSIRVRQISEMTGRPEGCYEIEYRPTIHSDNPAEATLSISFADLGDYTYRLILATQVAGIERILHFKAPLGGSQTQTFPFVSYSERSAELTCSVREPMFFSVPSTCKVDGSTEWEGKSCSVQIKFEPEALGEIRDTLTLFSDVVGEYKCTLQGVSMPPLPQGPFVFAGSKDLEFKNVFSTTRDFELMIDNPHFALSTKTMTITAKTAKTVTVRIEAPATGTSSAAGPIVGKLFISCPSLPELPPWVYYLEATLAQASST